jgi:S-adenosylmethionine:tRNA ribosyltransferase-isomerase
VKPDLAKLAMAMRTNAFDFDLPPDRIALRPASPRDAARLLVVRPGAAAECEDHAVRDLPDLLQPGDQLVVNDTKVIPAQLIGRRLRASSASGGLDGAGEPRIEATLIKRLDGARCQALAKPARKLKVGDVVRFGKEGKACFLGELDATVEAKGDAGEVTLGFAFAGPVLDQAIAERGAMPLPPYIAARRAADERDRVDYQTLFARQEGAVAAPTAGLHFTEALTARLAERGIGLHTVTLHVGAGTFLPVRADDTAGHRMHAEWGEVTEPVAAALNATRGNRIQHGASAPSAACGGGKSGQGRIVAVGTTSLRLIESAAREDGTIAPFAGETSLFITPGYRFRAVDLLLTNFHLPRSTLFMLVAAFSGLEAMKRAYAHAIAENYRFYSYGDACLLFPDRA